MQPVVPGDPLVRSSPASRPSPACGPWTMATATAWFSATTGLSEIRSSSSYSAMICGQSVSAALGASSCSAAIAAWSWYGPVGPRGSAPVISATPSAMQRGSQLFRSCSAMGTSSPSGPVRAGRRASVSSISASSPVTSPSPGSSRCSSLASRIASAASSARCRPGPEVLAYPSLKIR